MMVWTSSFSLSSRVKDTINCLKIMGLTTFSRSLLTSFNGPFDINSNWKKKFLSVIGKDAGQNLIHLSGTEMMKFIITLFSFDLSEVSQHLLLGLLL